MFKWILTLLILNIALLLPTYCEKLDFEFRLYTSDEPNLYEAVEASRVWYYYWEYFNPEFPTVIYVMGYWSNVDELSSTQIRHAYLESTNCNYVVVNWEALVNTWYYTAVVHARNIAPLLADLIQSLVRSGANESSIHMIGFSLGAHAAGFAGRASKARGLTIGRITGLDPAGPGFGNKEDCLSSADATFVDIIHTDTSVFGSANAQGDAEFYPNYDYSFFGIMPGCFPAMPGCSHSRAWHYYAESVRRPYGFPAVGRYPNFCITNYMGMGAKPMSCREYFLSTNSNTPYARYGF